LQTVEHILFRDLPAQVDADNSYFFIQIKSIDQWFEELPLANFQASVKIIYNALILTNQKKFPSKERLYFMEKIHSIIVDMTENLTRGNLNQQLPFDKKHHLIELLIDKLHTQAAIAYKIILQEIIASNSLYIYFNKRYLKPLLIARIMRHHSLYLMAAYQFYAPPKKNLWAEIHQLFIMAYSDKLLQKKISERSFSLLTEITIKRMYLQIVLTALADPYNMPQNHIVAVFKQLEIWSSLVKIHPYQAEQSLFINLHTDKQPVFASLEDNPDTTQLWELDCSELNHTSLMEFFDNKKIQSTGISRSLLTKLSFSWGDTLKRDTKRRKTKATYLKVAIGIDSIYYVLNNYNEPEWLQSDAEKKALAIEEKNSDSRFFSINIESPGEANDIWKQNYYAKNASSEKVNEKVELSEMNRTEQLSLIEAQNSLLQWTLINKSQGGYCLQWDKSKEPNIKTVNVKVAQIIAVCHSQECEQSAWFVGIIRWLKCVDSNIIQVGVQVLAHNAIAGSIAKFSCMQEGVKTRAILLPEVKELKQPKTLIATALKYKVNEQVILDDHTMIDRGMVGINHHKTKIVLAESLDNSPQFSHFRYVLAKNFYTKSDSNGAIASAQTNTHEEASDNSEFDSLWNDL